MPYLSIIVPIYNKAAYLEDCVDSILKQSFSDFELILINDGSSDESGIICNKFKELDERIVVIHQENRGVSSARNAGIDIAQGEFLGFVDSDDSLEEDMYELLLGNAEKYNADVSICGVRRVFPGKESLDVCNGEVTIYNSMEALKEFFSGNILLSNYEKIYRKNVVKDIRFRPALFEDTFYNFEALRFSKAVVLDPTIKYNYILRDNSHSMSVFNNKQLNTVYLSRVIYEICLQELPLLKDYAKAFYFRQKMIVLNMILYSGYGKNYSIERKRLISEIRKYPFWFRPKNIIHKRYRFGFIFLKISPFIYKRLMKLYGRLSNSEHLKRK